MKVYDGEDLGIYLKDYDLVRYHVEVEVNDKTCEVMIIYDGEVLRSTKVMSTGDYHE